MSTNRFGTLEFNSFAHAMLPSNKNFLIQIPTTGASFQLPFTIYASTLRCPTRKALDTCQLIGQFIGCAFPVHPASTETPQILQAQPVLGSAPCSPPITRNLAPLLAKLCDTCENYFPPGERSCSVLLCDE